MEEIQKTLNMKICAYCIHYLPIADSNAYCSFNYFCAKRNRTLLLSEFLEGCKFFNDGIMETKIK